MILFPSLFVSEILHPRIVPTQFQTRRQFRKSIFRARAKVVITQFLTLLDQLFSLG